MLSWLISQPEACLSAKWAQMDALNIPTTFLRPEIGLNPAHEPVVRRDLTAHLDRLEADIWEEVGMALEVVWGKDSQSWREVNLDHTIRRVVARAANRVFVGDKLCRNDDYIENSIRYVTQVSAVGLLMNLFPSWVKRFVGVIFTTPIRITYSRCSKHLIPVFSELTSMESSAYPCLFSSWLVTNADKFSLSSPERTPDYLSRRIMALNFAAIHTSTMTTCNLLLDVFSSVSSKSFLYEESLDSSSRWDKICNRTRLNQMPRLDSALRESLRLWGVVAKAMSRKIIHPDGAILPTGQHLPQGVTVCISGWGLHHDEAIYPQPFEFVHDRFMRTLIDGQEKAKGEKGASTRSSTATAVEIDERFVTWGVGKHACPGRFFAVDVVKIILAHVLLEYEVEILDRRAENMWIEYNVIPPHDATLRVKRRGVVSL
ncbi:hypothetical protein GQX73_g3176 [Xylaria multiplex]|uniref:Cytochrome P450 n=1 Tax=Xylaria multiplex TaxID=323545 RepID=A0A7C8IUJ8_9PEZI|nr:hypothetical protein GQX73_g3176 [Xylaria multiplex]